MYPTGSQQLPGGEHPTHRHVTSIKALSEKHACTSLTHAALLVQTLVCAVVYKNCVDGLTLLQDDTFLNPGHPPQEAAPGSHRAASAEARTRGVESGSLHPSRLPPEFRGPAPIGPDRI